MSEQTTEVVMKLTADAAGVKKGVAEARKAFNALAEAKKRLERADQERDVRRAEHAMRAGNPARERQKIHDEAAQGLAAEERAKKVAYERWRQTPWARRSVLPPGALQAAAPAAAGVYAAQRVFSAAGNAADHIGQLAADRARLGGGSVSAEEATGIFAQKLMESVPIIGGLVRETQAAAKALGGIPAQVAMAQAGIAVTKRQNAAARFESEQRASAAGRLYGIGLEVSDARAEAQAQSGYVGSLSADRLGQYRGEYGNLYRGADQARVAAGAARAKAAERSRIAGGADPTALRAAAEDARRVARDKGVLAQDAARRSEAIGNASTLAPWNAHAAADAARDAAEKQKEAATAEALAREKSAKLLDQARVAEQQITEAKQAQVAAAQAELAAKQAELAINRQLAETGRAGAVAASFRTPQGTRHLERLIDIAERKGIKGLTIAQRQEIANTPEYTARYQRLAQEQYGGQTAGLRQRGAAGLPAEQQQFAGKSIQEQQDAIVKAEEEARQKFTETVAKESQNWGKEMATTVVEQLGILVESFKAELRQQMQEEILAKKGQ